MFCRDRYWGAQRAEGPAVPRISRRETDTGNEAPFVPTIRPPLHRPTPFYSCHATPLPLPHITPWTQPRTIPGLPSTTPTWLPGTNILWQTLPLPCVAPCVPLVTASPYSYAEALEPGTFPPLPYGAPVAVRLHPSLIYNPVNISIPSLDWDISHHSEQARQYTGRLIFVKPKFSEKATMPPASSMEIHADDEILQGWMVHWGPIRIDKVDITVCDVLDGISDYMRTPLTTADVIRVGLSDGRANLDNAARRRIKDGYDLPDVAHTQTYRRVDVLGSLRKFLGLRVQVNHEDRTWMVFMGLKPLVDW